MRTRRITVASSGVQTTPARPIDRLPPGSRGLAPNRGSSAQHCLYVRGSSLGRRLLETPDHCISRPVLTARKVSGQVAARLQHACQSLGCPVFAAFACVELLAHHDRAVPSHVITFSVGFRYEDERRGTGLRTRGATSVDPTRCEPRGYGVASADDGTRRSANSCGRMPSGASLASTSRRATSKPSKVSAWKAWWSY